MPRPTSSSLLALSLVTLLAAAAPAQDAPPDGQALLKDAAGYDEALEGWRGLGVYMAGARNMGTASIEVRRAEAPATYAVTARQKMTFGGETRSSTEELLLDERLALLSSTGTEEETQGGKTVRKTTTTRRDGDAWVHEVTAEGQAPTSQRLALAGPLYGDLPVLVLFLCKTDLTTPGEWRLQGIRWAGEARLQELRIRIPAERARVVHRGQEVEVTQVVIERVGRDVTTFAVHAERGVLSLALEGAPVSMVAGTAEEIAADLPAAGPTVEPGVEAPEQCLRVYMEVLAKLRPADEADTVVDWQAVYDDMAPSNPQVADLGVAGLRAAIRQAAGRTPIERAQLEAALAAATVTLDGEDRARVTLLGRDDDPFLLRRGERGWRIVGLPR